MTVSVVQTSEARYGVQVANPSTGYRQVFGTYALDSDGLRAAQLDAEDWVNKYKAAGIQVEFETVEAPMRRRYRDDEDDDVEVRRAVR